MSFGGEDYIDRSNFAEKSGAAELREAEAKAAFSTHKASTDETLRKPGPRALEPRGASHRSKQSFHAAACVVAACFRDFSRFVKTHPGWSASRRTATAQEKSDAKQKRKGKVFFVDVVFKPHLKKKRLAPVSTNKAAGPAKKQKSSK